MDQKESIQNRESFLTSLTQRKLLYNSILKLPWKGCCFLFSLEETAENVLQQTDLPKKISSKWNINSYSNFQDGVLSFGVDGLSQQTFERNFKRCNF
jgi:hypothetical protein